MKARIEMWDREKRETKKPTNGIKKSTSPVLRLISTGEVVPILPLPPYSKQAIRPIERVLPYRSF